MTLRIEKIWDVQQSEIILYEEIRWAQTSLQVYEFVTDQIAHFKFNVPCSFLLRKGFEEMIRNSYDSFRMSPPKDEKPLKIKVVVCLNKGGLMIKVKDNGQGFFDHEKKKIAPGEKFARGQIGLANKKEYGRFLGGEKVGLRNFDETIDTLGGTLRFKNRKNGGAAVYTSFPAPVQRSVCSIRAIVASTLAVIIAPCLAWYYYTARAIA